MFVSPYPKIYSIHLGSAGQIHGACNKHLSNLIWIQQDSAGFRGFVWVEFRLFFWGKSKSYQDYYHTIFLTNAVSPINCESKLWLSLCCLCFFQQLSDRLKVFFHQDPYNISPCPQSFLIVASGIYTISSYLGLPRNACLAICCTCFHSWFSMHLTVIPTQDQGKSSIHVVFAVRPEHGLDSRIIRSVASSSCERWFHKNWLNMPTVLYEQLEITEVSWYCCGYGLPNFNSCFLFFFVPASIQCNPLSPPHRGQDCSSVPVVLFDTLGITRCRSQHICIESSSLLHHSIYLWFICFTWWSIDELENLHADRTTVCFEPW